MECLYNLRPLFLFDPFEHSGLYDVEEHSLFWDRYGVTKSFVIGSHNQHRMILKRIIHNEPEVQAVIVALLQAGVKRPRQALNYAAALKKLRGCHTIVLSNALLKEMQVAIQGWHLDENGRKNPPAHLSQLLDFLKTCDLRKVRFAPHHEMADDLLIGVKGEPDELGLIGAPNWFPYPVGIALRNPNLLVPVRTKTVVYNKAKEEAMNVREVIHSLLDAQMDAEVGVIHDGKFYPVRLIAERVDPNLRLGITATPPFEGKLHVISYKTRLSPAAIQIAHTAGVPLKSLTPKQAKRIRKDYKKGERKR